MTTCKNEYKDFFDAAKKIMHSDSMLRAEEKAEQILLALRLSDLQNELKLPQTEIDELSQVRIPKIENKIIKNLPCSLTCPCSPVSVC